MVEADIIDRRLPYQTNGTMRKAINAGKVKYADIHLSHMAQMVRYGYMAGRPTGRMLQSLKFAKSMTSAMAK